MKIISHKTSERDAPPVAGACRFVASAVDDLSAQWKILRPEQAGVELSLIQARALTFGAQAWIFSLLAEGRCVGAAVASLQRGRMRSSLNLTLTAELPDRDAFWDGVMAFVRQHDITNLWVESVGFPAPAESLPEMAGEHHRFSDVKLYVVDLERDDPFSAFSHGTKSTIKKARKNAAEVVVLPPFEAVARHCDLIEASLARRAQRGEQIKNKDYTDYVNSLLEKGAGRLYQAAIGGAVVSSKFVFFLGDAAFWDSSGTSPEGMRLGASQFLMFEMMQLLRADGLRVLNLDVASVGAGGLGAYKAGFGADIGQLERVDVDCSSHYKMLRNGCRSLWRLARS